MATSEIARTQQPREPSRRPRPGPVIGALVGLLVGAIVPGVMTFLLALSGKLTSGGESPSLSPLLFGLALVGLSGGAAAAAIGAITGWVGRLPELTGPAVGVVLVEAAALAFLAATGELNPEHEGLLLLTVFGGGFGFFSGLLVGVALRIAGLLHIRETGRVVPFLGGCALTCLFLGVVLGEVARHIELH